MSRDQNPTLSKRPFSPNNGQKRLSERAKHASAKRCHAHRRISVIRRLQRELKAVTRLYHNNQLSVNPDIYISIPFNAYSAEHSRKTRERLCARRSTTFSHPQSVTSKLCASRHSIVRFAERHDHVDLVKLHNELVTAGTEQPYSLPNTAGRRAAHSTRLTRVEEARLFRMLMCLRPQLIADWEAKLLKRLHRYRRWPSRNFKVVDRTRHLAFVIKDYVIVSVIPTPRSARR